MCNNITIDNSASTLLQLLRIAINGQVCGIINKVDWLNVMKLAQKQGIRGLTYEALERLRQEDTDCV